MTGIRRVPRQPNAPVRRAGTALVGCEARPQALSLKKRGGGRAEERGGRGGTTGGDEKMLFFHHSDIVSFERG